MAAQATPAVLLTLLLLARGATFAAAISTMQMAARVSKAESVPGRWTKLGDGHCTDAAGHRPEHCNTRTVATEAECAQHCLDIATGGCMAYEWGHQGDLCELIADGTDITCPANTGTVSWNHGSDGSSAGPITQAGILTPHGKCYLKDTSPTPAPTAAPTPAPPTAAPAPGSSYSAASAKGDPHLENVLGQRFDLMQPGKHVLVQIPRLAPAQRTLLSVVASAFRLGPQCGDVYFQDINITGAWLEAKHDRGTLQFLAADGADEMGSTWMTFGTVDLKVVHGRTLHGVRYLNFYAKHLAGTGFVVGGLLGEDDHEGAATPDKNCLPSIDLRVTS